MERIVHVWRWHGTDIPMEWTMHVHVMSGHGSSTNGTSITAMVPNLSMDCLGTIHKSIRLP